jgi:hypothetical protein
MSPFIINMIASIVAVLFSNFVWPRCGIEVSAKHAAAGFNPTAVSEPRVKGNAAGGHQRRALPYIMVKPSVPGRPACAFNRVFYMEKMQGILRITKL